MLKSLKSIGLCEQQLHGDRFGKPIPSLRSDQMTRAQLRASLSIPRNPELEAEALAEEEAMIAEQKAIEAASE